MITVVTPVSPIKSHPDTVILEETLDSVRHHLPDAEIILMFDGVREQHQHRRGDYEEATRRTLWLADKHYGNIAPFIFDKHTHQVGMMRATIDHIRTPLLMFVEQDTPLCVDRAIDFDQISWFIQQGHSNLVRLSHEASILDAHKHMFHGLDLHGPFTKTTQYSARPHIASVAFYRRLLNDCFTPDANCFLEDKLHGVMDNAYQRDGMAGWQQHRMHMWTPEGDIKRTLHSDGRAGEDKLDGTQIF